MRVFLLTTLLELYLASSSLLDIPRCDKMVVKSDFGLTSTHLATVTSKSRARTLIECLLNCKKSFPYQCNAVFMDDTESTCYELNGGIAVDENDAQIYKTGLAVDLLASREQVEECNGLPCDGRKEVCLSDCSNGGSSQTKMCLGDQSEECDRSEEYRNIRHFWSPGNEDDTDSGVIMSLTYPKQLTSSALRVSTHMLVRGHHGTADMCTYWYLQFNGNKCSNPASIQHLDYCSGNQNHHRMMDMDGTCYGLDSGDILVELVVSPCTGYVVSDAYAGFGIGTSVVIMEISSHDDEMSTSKPCPLLSTFNYDYSVWDEERDETIDLTLERLLIKEVAYRKSADDTSLRIKYTAVTSVIASSNTVIYCARWSLWINGTECTPQLDFGLLVSTPNQETYWREHRRSRTAEGICDNDLPAGVYNIEIWIGDCPTEVHVVPTAQPTRTITGGFESPSRLHIEEVRTGHPVDGVKVGKSIFRSHVGNAERYHYWQLFNNEDVGDILTVTYTKIFSETGLRLTASGDHRITNSCNRWYFKINGLECTNPGKIDGRVYLNVQTNYHQPMQVSGICYGIASGDRSITYAVAECSDLAIGDAHTGWRMSFHIFVDEIRGEDVKVCSGKLIDCN